VSGYLPRERELERLGEGETEGEVEIEGGRDAGQVAPPRLPHASAPHSMMMSHGSEIGRLLRAVENRV